MKTIYVIKFKNLFFWISILFILSGVQAQSNCDVLVCKNNLKFTIEKGMTLPITAKDLLDLGYCENHNYKSYYLQNGVEKNLNIIHDGLPKYISFYIVNLVNGKSCQGFIESDVKDCIEDYIPPIKNRNIARLCSEDNSVLNLGLGFGPTSVSLIPLSNNKYKIKGMGKCADFDLSIKESSLQGSCTSAYDKLIYRQGTISRIDCIQFTYYDTIRVEFDTTNPLMKFEHFDFKQNMGFNCKDNYARNASGLPHNDLTGFQFNKGCIHLSFMTKDTLMGVRLALCEDTLMYIRKWTMINWCTSKINIFNQNLFVVCPIETEAPIANCKNEIYTIQMQGLIDVYVFAKDLQEESSDNCEIVKYSFDEQGIEEALKVVIKDTGKVIDVDIWVHDLAGNKSKCNARIKVLPDPLLSSKDFNANNTVKLKVIPNPVSDKAYIYIEGSLEENSNIYIFNSSGKLIDQIKCKRMNGKIEIPLDKMEARGFYFIRYFDKYNQTGVKVVRN